LVLEPKKGQTGKLQFNCRDWKAHMAKLERLGLTPKEAITFLSEFMEAPDVQVLLSDLVLCYADYCKAKRPLNESQFYCGLKCVDCSINEIYKQKLSASQLKEALGEPYE